MSLDDENFKHVANEAQQTFEKITNLAYRGHVSDLDIEELDKIQYDLGLLMGLLEAVRAQKTGQIDTAEGQDNG